MSLLSRHRTNGSMIMSYTEITEESWLSRIGGAIKGIIVGIILVPLSIILLFWNEGREVKRSKALEEGINKVIEIKNDSVDPKNDGKLVHLTGEAMTQESLSDPQYGVQLKDTLKLKRIVEYYQIEEHVESESNKNLGGSKTTKKNYTYTPNWVPSPIDSSTFADDKEKRVNKVNIRVEDQTFACHEVSIGAFSLSSDQLRRVPANVPVGLQDSEFPTPQNHSFNVSGNYFYHGADPTKPNIGDVRVSFQKAPAGEISLIAQQHGKSFTAYQAKTDSIDLIETGIHSSDAMFEREKQANKTVSWVLRAAGAIAMAIGFSMIMRPLSVLADVVPFIGNIIGTGTGLLAILLTLLIAPSVIAIAWLFYRPLLSVGLFAITGLAAYLIIKRKKKRATA